MATKKEQGGHSPYEPYKPAPSGPYTPAPSRDSIKIASGDSDIKSMHYPTEKGFFLEGTGKAYMQNKGKLPPPLLLINFLKLSISKSLMYLVLM